MNNINEFTCEGNLGSAPVFTLHDSKQKPGEKLAIARFSVAVNNGKKTNWIRIKVFNKLAETCNQYLKKGSHVLIAGRLDESRWTDENGNNRSMSEIVATKVRFLDKKPQTEKSYAPPETSEPASIPDDDLPF